MALLEVEGLGSLRVDTAYGGDSFVMVDAADLGFAITPDEAADLASVGARLTRAANEQLGFVHPENEDWRHVSFCQVAGPLEGVPAERDALHAPGHEHAHAARAGAHALPPPGFQSTSAWPPSFSARARTRGSTPSSRWASVKGETPSPSKTFTSSPVPTRPSGPARTG